jgi:hypothetical protein
MPTELVAEQLQRTCPPQALGCHTTEELPPLERIIGQEQVVRALRFGLSIRDVGFNIYIAGLPGTVRDGQFHVWTVSTIREGIEILTGVPAESRD